MAAPEDPKLDNSKIIYTSAELAAMLGIAPTTLMNWRCSGRGPAYVRIGSKHSPVVYRACDIERWLSDRVVGA